MSEHKIKVAVLFGGVSSEHEISLLSVESVLSNLSDEYEVLRIGITKDGRWVEYTGADNEITSQKWESDLSLRTAVFSPDRSHHGFLMLGKDGSCEVVPVDVCFPVLHGKHGEDGTIQGLFQLAGIPFVGCNMISSANCMDKEMTHTILEANGIRMAKWVIVNEEKMAHFEEFAQQAEEKLGYPMFVKPANAGSSVGVGKAHNREELKRPVRLRSKRTTRQSLRSASRCRRSRQRCWEMHIRRRQASSASWCRWSSFTPTRQNTSTAPPCCTFLAESARKPLWNCARPRRKHLQPSTVRALRASTSLSANRTAQSS